MMTKHQTSSNSLLMTMLVISTMTMISTTNWIMLWLAMEMNLMSMIPLIMMSKMSYETESAIKYFLIQAASSSLLLTSMIMQLSSSLTIMSAMLFISSLMMKMGMAPFHLWLPNVFKSLTWNMIIIVSTWQKLGPLLIISYTIHLWNPTVLLIIVMTSAILGSLGGINQTQLRPLIAYSSISHMAWMIASSSMSFSMTYLYFIIYSMITIMLVMPMKSMTKMTTNKFDVSAQLSSNMSLTMMMNLLSLSGMPPLLGFIPKWMVVSMLVKTNIIMPTILIASSLLSLFFYLMLFFTSTLNSNKSMMLNLSASLMSQSIPMNIFPTAIILMYL